MYALLELGVALVGGILLGALCALLAERRSLPGRWFFALGVVVGTAATAGDAAAGSWLWVGVAALAPFVVVMIDARPTERPFSERPRNVRSFWWLRTGALVIAAVVAFGPLAGALGSLRRTASVPAEIVDSQPTIITGGNDYTPAILGLAVTYRFEVDGRAYRGFATRRWKTTEGAKVCYDPQDPAGNHLLVPANYPCGTLDPFAAPG